MSGYVVGVDPSSRLVASIIATEVNGSIITQRNAVRMPPKMPARTCQLAYMGMRRLLRGLAEETDTIDVFIEAPTYIPRAGANSLIPQAQVNGALLAAASSVPQVRTIENVPPARWKKAVIKKGTAGKPQIKEWCAKHWRDAYDLASGEQDFYDAAGICFFGMKVSNNITMMKG